MCVLGGGSKNFYTPPKLLVCVFWGGSGRSRISCRGGMHPLGGHGPLTWALFGENVCENERIGSHLSMEGLKTETGKFLLHFQNSKWSNRCQSVYGTDVITIFTFHQNIIMVILTKQASWNFVITVPDCSNCYHYREAPSVMA